MSNEKHTADLKLPWESVEVIFMGEVEYHVENNLGQVIMDGLDKETSEMIASAPELKASLERAEAKLQKEREINKRLIEELKYIYEEFRDNDVTAAYCNIFPGLESLVNEAEAGR